MRIQRDLGRRTLCAGTLVAVVLLASAASAMGQAAVDQYLPSAKPGTHHGGARAAVSEARADAASTTVETSKAKAKKTKLAAAMSGPPGDPTGSDDGGYPLTLFVIIVTALFLVGLAARYLPRLIERWRAE
jgi:hypothetical protein